MHKDASLYFTGPIQRLSLPERYFTALLFAFKLFAGAMTIILFFLRQISLSNENGSEDGFTRFSNYQDYHITASFMNGIYLIAGGVILIGGLFQLLKHSRRAGLWSLTFGVLILTIAIAYSFFLSSHQPSYIETYAL